ncbi:MAG: hypothetical protein IJ647_05310 [Prevotella sp.]|nr:hypothetical protein [Prevotella sp.]
MRRVYIIILLLSLPLFILNGRAQVDAGRAIAVGVASAKSKKHLETNEKMQALMTEGHIFFKAEEKATTEFQKEFNEYLDTLTNMLSIAVEIYGIYYEVTKTAKNLKELNNIVANAPQNALATAFSSRRNKVYRNLMKEGLDLCGDIKTLCFGQTKMTQAQREIMLKNIRPKMHRLNRMLVATAITIKYTTFNDVWAEIRNRAESYDLDKKSIAEQCFERWRIAGKNSY